MVEFIDYNKHQYGTLAVYRVLPIAPSTYHRAKYLECYPEQRSLCSQNDDFYISEIRCIWQDSKCRYGARKVWQQLKMNGLKVACCTVERLMKQYELQGIWRDVVAQNKILFASDWLTQDLNTLVKSFKCYTEPQPDVLVIEANNTHTGKVYY